MNAADIWPFLAGVVLAAIATPLLIKFAKKKGLVFPRRRARDIHTSPLPRLGGISIFLSFLIVVLVVNYFFPERFAEFHFPFKILGVSIDKRLLGILLAGVLIIAVMTYDDLKGLNPYLKLGFQILAGLVLIASGIGLIYLNNPFGNTIYLDQIKWPVEIAGTTYHFILFADLLFLVWLIVMLNAVNFIDGIDGLAAGLVAIGLLVLYFLSTKVHQPATGLLIAILLGAVLGFLPYNFHPAKIFLGDSGAMFLGMMLATLSVISGGKLATLFLVLGIAIVDALLVVLRRIKEGKNPLTTPDQTHLHHRFLRAGVSVRGTLLSLYLLSAIFGGVALLFAGKFKFYAIGVLVVIILGLLGMLELKGKRNES